jgi:hypothetical protein
MNAVPVVVPGVKVVCGPLVLSMLPTFELLSTTTHVRLQGLKLQKPSKVTEEGVDRLITAVEGNTATCKAANAVMHRARTAAITPMPSTILFLFIDPSPKCPRMFVFDEMARQPNVSEENVSRKQKPRQFVVTERELDLDLWTTWRWLTNLLRCGGVCPGGEGLSIARRWP